MFPESLCYELQFNDLIITENTQKMNSIKTESHKVSENFIKLHESYQQTKSLTQIDGISSFHSFLEMLIKYNYFSEEKCISVQNSVMLIKSGLEAEYQSTLSEYLDSLESIPRNNIPSIYSFSTRSETKTFLYMYFNYLQDLYKLYIAYIRYKKKDLKSFFILLLMINDSSIKIFKQFEIKKFIRFLFLKIISLLTKSFDLNRFDYLYYLPLIETKFDLRNSQHFLKHSKSYYKEIKKYLKKNDNPAMNSLTKKLESNFYWLSKDIDQEVYKVCLISLVTNIHDKCNLQSFENNEELLAVFLMSSFDRHHFDLLKQYNSLG